jgi:hypothetical protein
MHKDDQNVSVEHNSFPNSLNLLPQTLMSWNGIALGASPTLL